MASNKTLKGGRRRRGGSRKRRGGRTRRGGTWTSGLTKLAVPAGLLWANNMYRPGAIGRIAKRDAGITKRRRRRRRRGSRSRGRR